MQNKLKRILSFLLCFVLIFQQIGFAQVAAQLDILGRLAQMRSMFVQDKFRPLHLRYLEYLPDDNSFKLLLDKGSLNPSTKDIENTSKDLLRYFFIGLTLPNSSFWVNLRPDSPDNIIDPYVAQTDIGKIMLESDLQLKKDTARLTSPETPEGREYWNKLYAKAGELLGNDNVTIPTLTRPWIVPDEIVIRETTGSAYIYKATLKVMLEQDYLKDSATYNFKDPRLKELNEYSSQLVRELIIPKLTQEINTSKRYAPLRQVYYSLILAQWFKVRFADKNTGYSNLIDRRRLNNLMSKEDWSKTAYFQAYQKSFKDGEYNIKEPVYTPYGQNVRSYFSGGITGLAPGVMPEFGGQAVIDPNTGAKISSSPAVAESSLWQRGGSYLLPILAFVSLSANAADPTEMKIEVQERAPIIMTNVNEHKDKPEKASEQYPVTQVLKNYEGVVRAEQAKPLDKMLRERGYGERSIADISREFDAFFNEIDIAKFKKISLSAGNDPKALISFLSMLHHVLWETGYDGDILRPRKLMKLLVTGSDVNQNDIFELLEKANMDESTKKNAIKEGLAACVTQSVLSSILLESLGFEVRYIEVPFETYGPRRGGHYFVAIPLAKNGLLIVDPRNDKFRILEDINIYYLKKGNYFVLRNEYKFSAEERRLFEQRLINGKYRFSDNLTTKEWLNFDYPRIAITDNTRAISALNNLIGLRYKELGKLAEAIIEFRKGISIDPNNPDNYNDLSVCLMKSGENDVEALKLSQRAVELNPDSPNYNFNLACSYYNLKMDKEAIDAFKKAIRLNPDYRFKVPDEIKFEVTGPGKAGESSSPAGTGTKDGVRSLVIQEPFAGPGGGSILEAANDRLSEAQQLIGQGGEANLARARALLNQAINGGEEGEFAGFKELGASSSATIAAAAQNNLDLANNLLAQIMQPPSASSSLAGAEADTAVKEVVRLSPDEIEAVRELDALFNQTLTAVRDNKWDSVEGLALKIAKSIQRIERAWDKNSNLDVFYRTFTTLNAGGYNLDITNGLNGGINYYQLFKDTGKEKYFNKATAMFVESLTIASRVTGEILRRKEMPVMRDKGILDVKDILSGAPISKGTVQPSASSSPATPQASMAPGGIDFRFLPVVTQSMDRLRLSMKDTLKSSLESLNLTKEWSDIERLINSGISPSAERIKDYLAASCFKGNLDNDTDKITFCIADILRNEEERAGEEGYISTNPDLKDILVVLGSGRSATELKTEFAGSKL
ncbi:MAG: tetratricopeptide repeat protein [Candidatus Omnitrophica bacterium]|nr:tetratricopeptide repeat protein [Candidatus Omnitrophota bacterium]